MGLVYCFECLNGISDTADGCPACGAPRARALTRTSVDGLASPRFDPRLSIGTFPVQWIADARLKGTVAHGGGHPLLADNTGPVLWIGIRPVYESEGTFIRLESILITRDWSRHASSEDTLFWNSGQSRPASGTEC